MNNVLAAGETTVLQGLGVTGSTAGNEVDLTSVAVAGKQADVVQPADGKIAANDSKATVSVSGKRMDPGFNTTTITVTAENGSKRTYTIYIKRLPKPSSETDKNETSTNDKNNTQIQPAEGESCKSGQ